MIESIKKLPSSCGVYQYFDQHSKLLYIGKAKNLKNRVKSYWRFTPSLQPNPTLNPRIIKMLAETVRLEYIVVDSEEDALILENSLIKQLRPKYNILLRDDKTYPYIYIDESQEFPRFELTRKVIKGNKIRYYGPFPNGGKALLDAIYEIYQLVQKKSCLRGGQACLFYQIEKCLAPCEQKITSKQYHEIIAQVKKAINDRKTITVKLQERMSILAKNERYEEAGKIRDQISQIKSLKINSSIDMANSEDIDIIAISNTKEQSVIVKLFIRNGKLVSSARSLFRGNGIFDIAAAYRQVLLDFYSTHNPSVPKSILVAESFDSMSDFSQILSKRIGKKIIISSPQRGKKKRLVELSLRNGQELLKNSLKKPMGIEPNMKDLLELERSPHRVEIFDNSHMMGVATVGAMVVWNEGIWERDSYRRYKLAAKDEYGQMTEMLQRRISSFDTNPAPDLWVLDGGQANLNLAVGLLKTIGVNLDVVAIAKEKLDSKANRAKGAAKDIIYSQEGILKLKSSDKRLQWLQKLRDESHRFAIAYHKNLKRREDTQISLLNKKGIGKATVKKLIDYFGSFDMIEKARHEEIASVTNKSIAQILSKKA
ncbi:MAG: excinuclease ABC subunit UvrC [Sulfurovum sp.]|nr:excinuclease ABC subunit UvrC [Sulfurovum sp.]